MTPREREEFYDTEIAPVLLGLAAKCQESGLSMVCDVEWESDPAAFELDSGRGTTSVLAKGSSFAIRLVELAARVSGNVDGMIMALLKLPPGGSMFLHQLKSSSSNAET